MGIILSMLFQLWYTPDSVLSVCIIFKILLNYSGLFLKKIILKTIYTYQHYLTSHLLFNTFNNFLPLL